MSQFIGQLAFFGLVARMVGDMEALETTLRELVSVGRNCGMIDVEGQQTYLKMANMFAEARTGFENLVPSDIEFKGPVPVPDLSEMNDEEREE